MYTNYKTLLEEIKTDPKIESYRGFFRKKIILLKWYSYSSYQFIYSLQFLADFNNPLLLHKWKEVLSPKRYIELEKRRMLQGSHISIPKLIQTYLNEKQCDTGTDNHVGQSVEQKWESRNSLCFFGELILLNRDFMAI